MPGTPEERTITGNGPNGPTDMHFALVDREFASCLVGYADLPADAACESADDALNRARDGMVAGVHGKLQCELLIQLNGYPGREIRFEAAGGAAAVARLYMVKRRCYEIELVVPNDRVAVLNTDVPRKYFESFQLTEAP
jgi:hypothetical protein